MKKLLYLSIGVILTLFLFSCVKNLDFDQVKDFRYKPVVEADLFYFDLIKDDITPPNAGARFVFHDTIGFNFFEQGNTRNGFKKLELSVKYKNSLNRRFLTKYYFATESYQIVDSLTLDIASGTNAHSTEGEKIYTFTKTANPEFTNSRKIIIKTELIPPSIPTDTGRLHVQTKAKFFFDIKDM